MVQRVMLLFSGGGDSLLAYRWLGEAGFDVDCLHFDTGFVRPARRAAVRSLAEREPRRVEVVDVARAYLTEVVTAPRFGYGAGMNPCLDCRIFMLRRAAQRARELGIALLATGDVIGQRAIDQSRAALERIDREGGVDGTVLRPLSAALLPLPHVAPELAERLRCHGRSRREQAGLAARHAATAGDAAPASAGGGCCRLAERGYARRLRDLLAHRDAASLERADLERLALGRHFRLRWNAKIVVGRDEAESRALVAGLRGGERLLSAADGRGAASLVEGPGAAEALDAAAAIAARYAGGGRTGAVLMQIVGEDATRFLQVEPASVSRLAESRI